MTPTQLKTYAEAKALEKYPILGTKFIPDDNLHDRKVYAQAIIDNYKEPERVNEKLLEAAIGIKNTFGRNIVHGERADKALDSLYEAIQQAEQQLENDPWISVGDKPLIKMTDKHSWITVHACDEEMMVAIETNKGWYIKHCYITEDGSLMVIGEDDNECSGYGPLDIQYYYFIKPPKSK